MVRILQGDTCNHCGKKLDLFDQQNRFLINTDVGYGSTYDTGLVYLRLCNDCFDKLADECVISPLIGFIDI